MESINLNNLIMDNGEFVIGQVKKEVDFNDFDEAFQTDILKIDAYSYQDQNEVSFNVNKPTAIYVDQAKVPEDLSTNHCNFVEIKSENNVDTFHEDIKREIIEERENELYRFCLVCNKSSISETDIESNNEGFGCSCQEQTQSEETTGDLKPFSLCSTTDSVLQLFSVKDETISEDEHGNAASLAAPRSDSESLLENDKKLAPTNIPDDFPLLKRKCLSEPVEIDLFVKHQGTDPTDKKFQCKLCSKSFNLMIDLTVHERIGHLNNTLQCKICWKYFTHICNLRQHEKSHKRVRCYQCQTCDKKFTRRQYLRIHEETHVLEYTFHCKFCSKSFCRSKNLKKHENAHTKVKPFPCKICSAYYGSSKSLKSHEKVHLEKKQFHCKI